MDTSLSLCQKQKRRIAAEIADIPVALALAYFAIAVLAGQLRLPWNLGAAFRGGVLRGLACAWNTAADTLGNSNFILLPKVSGAGEDCGLFLTIVYLLTALIAWGVIRSRFVPLLPLFFGPQLLLGLVCSLHAPTWQSLCLVLSLLAALILMRMDGGLPQALVSAAVVAVGFFAVLGAVRAVTGRTWDAQAADMETSVLAALADRVCGVDPLGEGNIALRSRNTGTGEALVVEMSAPRAMYLRGFVGSRFTGSRWKDLPNTTYYKQEDLMRALRAEQFNAPGQLAQSAALVYDASGQVEIRVKNVGADRRIAYVPYEITEQGELAERMTKGGSQFYGGRFGWFREYSYSVADDRTASWTDVAARLFTVALAGEDGQTEVADYLRLESHYNGFVYDSFTAIAPADRALLAANIGTAGDQSEGHIDYKLAITAVRGFLEDNFIYSEDLGGWAKEKTNALADFLESHKGYDIHFATAATLMFRYYGIPSRYVEGYLITPEDAAAAEDGETVRVPRERAHAWTEIYIDGVGFVPIEVTPEYYGVMHEADLSVGISNSALVRDFQNRFGNAGSAQEEPPAPVEEEGSNPIFRIVWLLVIALLGVVLLLAFLLLLRRLARALAAWVSRRRLFYGSDAKRAVAAIYGYMEDRKLPCAAEIIDLGNRAAYSRQEISGQERAQMLAALRAARRIRARRGKKEEAHAPA